MKVVDAADVVIEVLDARDPLSCRCLDVERLVRRSGADKKVILLLNKIGESNSGDCCDALENSLTQILQRGQHGILLLLFCTVITFINIVTTTHLKRPHQFSSGPSGVGTVLLVDQSLFTKCVVQPLYAFSATRPATSFNCEISFSSSGRCRADLVPREVAEAWLKYLREELPTVAFKCSTQKQASNLGQRHLPKAQSSDSALQGSECLGANTLLQLLKNYTRNSDTKTAITVGKNSRT